MSESESNNDKTLERLDDQIRWYENHSSRQRRSFYCLKVVTVVAAAVIPLLSVVLANDYLSKSMTSSLGALIVITEGIQQLFQLQTNWILYRSTSEGLKREKYLYLGKAGPYADLERAHPLLAERVESLVSQDLTNWASLQQQARQGGRSANRHDESR